MRLPTSSNSCEMPNRNSVLTLSSVKPQPGEKLKTVSVGRLQRNTGAMYWEVFLKVTSPHTPKPPYTSTPAANFSAQKEQRRPVLAARGRLKPTAYPNSHFSPCTFLEP